jgi:FtsZ-binding cell division protein ZapB
MSFLDKVKATVKTGAEQAASKAQVEFERLQVKRELQQAYSDLGEKASELADRGELVHDELAPHLEHIRTAKAQLEAIGKEDAEPTEQPEEPPTPPDHAEEPPPA